MPDKIKVFTNAEVTPTPSNSAFSINLLTTNATTQAIVKDVYFKVKPPVNLALTGIFNPKAVLRLNGVPISEPAETATGLSISGNQVVDVNSTLTLEIQAETSPGAELYSTSNAISVLLGTTAGLRVATLNKLTLPTTAATVITDISRGLTTAAGTNTTCRSGCTFMRNGVAFFAYTDGGSLYLLDNLGANVTGYGWPTTINAIVSDDTFIYGKSTFADAVIYRYNHVTQTAGANLATNQGITGYGSSNKGWVDSFGGFMYVRATGGDGTTFKINLSTGVTTTFNGGAVESEFVGGVINTNRAGVTSIVVHGDTSFSVQNIDTLSVVNYTSVFSTNPTTTNSNQMISLAPGVVLCNNGSYAAWATIDTNVSPPLMTQYTSVPFAISSSTAAVMVGSRRQGTGSLGATPVRELAYAVHASGVEIT